MRSRVSQVLATLAIAACGGTTIAGAPGDAGAAGSAGDAGNTLDCGGDICVPADCDAAASAIAGRTLTGGACTSVVRLDYATLAPEGYQILCGAYAKLVEADARATAQHDTGFGQGGVLLGGPDPTDAWLFYESPGDFGGVGVVSVVTGLSVFGAGIVWMGKGDVTWPKTWDPPGELGSQCADPLLLPPPARGWDLAQGAPLPDDEVARAVNAVWSTALPAGLAKTSYFFDAVVLMYPPTVGGVDPSVAEYVVLVDSGWLE